ncbi:competence protein CoiA family protein [Priestia megaterium]|uniref:competence protein CoiA n=1 Tax=Priestia megaterium TaxID=1404 RepID=UPI0025AFD339|nr:competence protein CoiA family protein [Priestia megaterium]MDN3365478.1 competence protein CoiA family protein [Priestia megaterium]
MLRCITEDQETLYASRSNKEYIQQLVDEGKALCPNCLQKVIHKPGRTKRAHFAHYDSDCVVTNHEPETDSHIKGKQLLYKWLKNKFPNAYVEYEVYIPETKQIADVFIKHKEGDYTGLTWAFEFQHSNLSPRDWEERHNLYKLAGIQDFWILDKAKYLKFSTAKGHTDARKRNELEKTIYQEVGLCYFLDLEKEELIIDFNFVTKSEHNVFNRKQVTTYYTYHEPQNHASKVDKIRVRMNDEFKYCVLLYDEIEEGMTDRLRGILGKLQREKEIQLEEELQLRLPAKKDYCETIYKEDEAAMARSFIEENERKLADDIRNLSNDEFFAKYQKLIEKAITNRQSFKVLENSEDIRHKYITREFFSWHVYKMSVLESQSSLSIEEYLLEKYKDKISLIEYAYNTYKDIFEKLASRNTELLNRDLRKIKPFLQTYEKNPNAMDYALEYRSCKSTEEIDNYVNQVVEQIINYDPFADWEW